MVFECNKCGKCFNKSTSLTSHKGHCGNTNRVSNFSNKEISYKALLTRIKRKRPNKMYSTENILSNKVKYQSNKLRKRLLEEGYKESKCEQCKLDSWLNKPMPLELHHIDGNKFNNNLNNLMIICPNCHTFTDTYKSKNRIVNNNSNNIG